MWEGSLQARKRILYLCGGPAALARLYGWQNPYLLLEYSSVARAIEHLFVGRWPEVPTGLKGGAMAPVGPLDFVARQASVWIMNFYISATSFATFVGWTLDSFRVPEEVRMRYQTPVT